MSVALFLTTPCATVRAWRLAKGAKCREFWLDVSKSGIVALTADQAAKLEDVDSGQKTPFDVCMLEGLTPEKSEEALVAQLKGVKDKGPVQTSDGKGRKSRGEKESERASGAKDKVTPS